MWILSLNLQQMTENLVILIWQQLQPHIIADGAALHCIKLVETDTIYAEYFGE